jgi:RND family efflux transporter MFP subunit
MDSQNRKSSSSVDSQAPQPQSQPSVPEKHTTEQRHSGHGRTVAIALGIGAVVSLLAIGILPRLSQQEELKAAVKEQDVIPSVNVLTPRRTAANNLVLPGTVVSLNQTTIYAKTDGYLRRWFVDIGDRVRAGQVLAEIESPETDQQVLQAQAQLAQAQANLIQSRASVDKGLSDLKQARANLLIALQTWNRWKTLVKQGVVTQQEADTKYSTYQASLASVESAQNTVKVNQANVNANQALVNSSLANLRRYTVLQSYKKVTAPFTGIITARNVNAGVLVSAGSTTSTPSLYTIAAYDHVNVNVNVPQTLAQSLKNGQTAQIQVRELPRKIFTGKVLRTTNALDPNTRTLLTQVGLDNPDGILRPGMYATVKFNITRANPPLIIPDSALVINAQGTQVATVTRDNRVHYKKVELGRDYGTEVEVASGLIGNESLIATPTVDQTEGTQVKPVAQRVRQSK